MQLNSLPISAAPLPLIHKLNILRAPEVIIVITKNFKILNAEWAHLNRPDRLRKLAEYYFFELRLTPINPDDFISFSDLNWGESNENESTALVDNRLTGIEHEE